MKILYLVVVACLFDSLANGQDSQLEAEKTPVQGELGGELTLTWNILNFGDLAFAVLYLGTTVDKQKVLFDGRITPSSQSTASDNFGDRISAFITPPKYHMKLKNLQYNDSNKSFTLRIGIDKGTDGIKPYTKTITISEVNDPKKPGGGDPKKPGGGDPEKGSNTGAIVGGVIGGIVLIVLIVLGVLYFLRWKKNRGSS